MDRRSRDEVGEKSARRRTLTAAFCIFVLMPATIAFSTLVLDGSRYMITSLLIIVYTMVPFFMIFEKRKPKAREVVIIAMMTAITVVSHMFFHVILPVQIGTAMVIISGVALGPEAGFMVGALARFVCNFYMGQGPWSPWQMFCWGLLGFLAGLTFNKVAVRNRYEELGEEGQAAASAALEERKSRAFRMVMGPVMCVLFGIVTAYVTYLIVPGKDTTFWGWRVYAFGAAGLLAGALLQRKRMPVDSLSLSMFTFLTTVIIYGGIMNMAAMFTSSGIPGNDISFNTLRLLYISGLPYDLYHGITAAVCMFVVGNPMIEKLERIKIKYGIYR
ncbi:MAG: ECF transporter S component [Firmicutes bacterium]|nr:ECF transporter S component [Bacillota bacterium]